MKRKVSIILSLILLVSTTGFTIDKHYCNDKLVNIFLLPHFGKCCDSSMPVQDDACDDMQVEFLSGVPLEFIGAKIDLNTSIQESLLPETFLLRVSGSEVSVLKASVKKLSFSPVKKPKIYLQVESFLN